MLTDETIVANTDAYGISNTVIDIEPAISTDTNIIANANTIAAKQMYRRMYKRATPNRNFLPRPYRHYQTANSDRQIIIKKSCNASERHDDTQSNCNR